MLRKYKQLVDLFVVQPTTFCNIDCTYCYLPDRAIKRRLSTETLRISLNRLRDDRLFGKKFTLVWHAGEPLATGLKHFRELLQTVQDFVQREGVHVRHSIQSNGILINQEWCDLFKEHDIQIGISIDGPQFIHDSNRLTRNGKGTFDLVMKGIGFLRKNGIPYHGIAVVTERSLAFPKELFNFFVQNGFYNLGLNIEEIEGINSTSSVNENPAIKVKFQDFWKTIYELYVDSAQEMKIREFDHILNSIFRHPRANDIRHLLPISHQNYPFGIITMDTDGNFSTFSPELLGQKSARFNNFVFGNVRDHSFLKIKNSDVFQSVNQDIQNGVKKCRQSCKYFYLCGGGAPSNKYFENGTFDSTTTLYCEYTVKAPVDVVLSSLERQIGN